jgi:GTP pyrophosphokinase
MEEKHLSFAQVTDIYGFRLIVPTVISCYTGLGILHQMYKPLPASSRITSRLPSSTATSRCTPRWWALRASTSSSSCAPRRCTSVAESGVAAHWLYKAAEPAAAPPAERLGAKWLQSLLDIQDETADAAEFWDHVKVDLFPDAVYVFTPKSQIMALPRGATVVDFAYCDPQQHRATTPSARRINGDQVPLRTELKNGDVVEVVTAPVSTPNPAWLGFVRTGRARSKIRHHLKTLAQPSRSSWAKSCCRRRCAPKAWRSCRPTTRNTSHLGKAAALHRQPQPRRTAHRHRPGQAHRQHRGQASDDHAGASAAKSPMRC